MFSISIAIVIGPTPPGTGVIYEVLGATFSKSTSPLRRSLTRLIPTSTTTAPSLTKSAVTRFAQPAADTIISEFKEQQLQSHFVLET